MKLIFIYGPPAAGKLTISQELSKITKYNCLPHNMILDIIMPIISENLGDEELWSAYEKIKLEIIKSCKKKKRNLIITECYDCKNSDKRIKKFINSLKKLNVEIFFVKLSCSREELKKRVLLEDRKHFKKINCDIKLLKILKECSLEKEISFVKNLSIDNTKLSAKKVAVIIKNKLNLK